MLPSTTKVVDCMFCVRFSFAFYFTNLYQCIEYWKKYLIINNKWQKRVGNEIVYVFGYCTIQFRFSKICVVSAFASSSAPTAICWYKSWERDRERLIYLLSFRLCVVVMRLPFLLIIFLVYVSLFFSLYRSFSLPSHSHVFFLLSF